MANDLRCSKLSGEEGKADEPGAGVSTNLIDEFIRLSFEVLIGRGVPGNFNGILYLCCKSAHQILGRYVRTRHLPVLPSVRRRCSVAVSNWASCNIFDRALGQLCVE